MQVASRSDMDVPDLHRYELVKRRVTLRFCQTYELPSAQVSDVTYIEQRQQHWQQLAL